MHSPYQGQYQGYPYVNPHVTDVPVMDPAIAGRWTNLPRRQISASPGRPHGQGTQSTERELSSSTARMALPFKPEPNENPVVYIDLPEDGANNVTEHRPAQNRIHEPSTSCSRPIPSKPEPDETPVVYIDLPDDGGSDVSQRDQTRNEPQFVQETIFYDPFENRRIDVAKGSGASVNSESDVESIDSLRRVPPPRPPIPTNLDLPGCSGLGTSGISSICSSSPRSPDSYTRPLPESSLPASLPISGFPEPPPAYTEFEIRTPTPSTTSPIVDQPSPQPPRTQVILPGSTGSNPNVDRQYLKCQHCGMHVHTLVVKEVGLMTHLVALICLIICMVPCVILIYYMDFLKNKNHFCPNCNKVIGYELPISTKKVVYVC